MKFDFEKWWDRFWTLVLAAAIAAFVITVFFQKCPPGFRCY